MVFSRIQNLRHIELSFKAGASGFVSLLDSPTEFIAAVQECLKGEMVFPEQITKHKLSGLRGSGKALKELSVREVEVFDLIGSGFATSAIAKKLEVSVKTIETHRHHIKQKLNIPNAPELVKCAVSMKIAGIEN
jgi:DNA-binding NarL/FixJ family response regulator